MTYSADDHRSAIKATLDALPPPLHIKAICKACPHPAECRGKPCLNDLARPMLENNQHSRLMLPQQAQLFAERVRAGVTRRRLTNGTTRFGATYVCTPQKFDAHAHDYPIWGTEMVDLLAKNAKAADALKGIPHKNTDGKCRRGHLLPTEPNAEKANGRRYTRCVECSAAAQKRGRVPGEEVMGKVLVQLLLKRPIKSFTSGGEPGFILAHRNFKALRRGFPEIDRLARENILGANSRAQKARYQIDESEVTRTPAMKPRKSKAPTSSVELTFEAIDAVVPTNLPPDMRSDVINDIWVAAKDGKITADGLAACVSHFTASYNKMFPTKYAKFGNAPLVSLDATLYEDGTTTRGDTVSEGLWG